METKWSLGVLIGGPISLIIIGALVWIVIWGLRDKQPTDYGWTRGKFAWFWGSILLAITLIVVALAYFPYKAEYHQWRPVNGTVVNVSSRILGSDGDINQRFVVQFTNGELRSCDDTRCSLIKKGDKLFLMCKKSWQFSGESGYDCNYVRRESNG